MLLSNPAALESFGKNDVVLPIIVLTELEDKRHHPELGWAARSVLRRLERVREENNGLTEPYPINDQGGTVRVELNHKSDERLPPAMREGNDSRILLVAVNLQAEGHQVTLVTQDLPLRLRAGILGLDTQEYAHQLDADLDWRGIAELSMSDEVVDELYRSGSIQLPAELDLPVNTGLILNGNGQGHSALARVRHGDRCELIQERTIFGVRGRNAEQRIALELLADESIGIVSLGGPAGTGKSVMALAAGLEAVLERKTHRKVMIFRPLYSVGGQDLGFLPGSEEEKMRPWTDAVNDALEAITNEHAREEIERQGLIEVLPLTYIRGRTLTDMFVIVDEAQNLERSVLLTALSRLGLGSRVVLTHDVAQRDNLRVGRHDGIASVVASLRRHDLFAHVTLQRSERSPIAALVADALDIE